MKITNITELPIPEVKLVTYERFADHRGYFSETFRASDLSSVLPVSGFRQANESYSRRMTVRGLHFQWGPPMGKLVRVIVGRMIDVAVDLRKGSRFFGTAVAADMSAVPTGSHCTWIWVPPGFAHGNLFLVGSTIEYLCTAEYGPGCEAGISPFASDIDWSLVSPEICEIRRAVYSNADRRVSPKDLDAPSVAEWADDPRSNNMMWGVVPYV